MEDLKMLKAGEHLESDEPNELNIETSFELENFEEAAKLVNKVFYDSHKIPDNLQTLLLEVDTQTDDCQQINSFFWIMMKSLGRYIQKYNCLPLRGTIPDMNCGSEEYIQLQKLYKSKAKDDIDKLFKIAQKLTKSPKVKLVESDIQLFCKNVRYLNVLRTSTIYNELYSDRLRLLAKTRLQNGTDEEGLDNDELRFYILMRLIDRFYSKHNRFPGQTDDEVESHISELKVFHFYCLISFKNF